jgi:hypothetical protein
MFEILHVLLDLLGTDRARESRRPQSDTPKEIGARRPPKARRGICRSPEFDQPSPSPPRSRRNSCTSPPESPGRGDPGVVHSADHDTDPGALAVWKFRFQNILLHEGIAERDGKEIEGERVEKSRDHSDFVDARSDAANELMRPQLFKRSPSGTEELTEMGRNLGAPWNGTRSRGHE